MATTRRTFAGAKARKTSSRVVLNRAALTEVGLALADGMAVVAQAYIETANVPDAEPLGQGLVKSGDWGVWVEGRKVAGTAAKPRSAKVKPGIVALAGWGFPARLVETGTVDTRAQPFASQNAAAIESQVAGLMAPVVSARLGRRP